jgi:hypothetical protein
VGESELDFGSAFLVENAAPRHHPPERAGLLAGKSDRAFPELLSLISATRCLQGRVSDMQTSDTLIAFAAKAGSTALHDDGAIAHSRGPELDWLAETSMMRRPPFGIGQFPLLQKADIQLSSRQSPPSEVKRASGLMRLDVRSSPKADIGR